MKTAAWVFYKQWKTERIVQAYVGIACLQAVAKLTVKRLIVANVNMK